VFIDFLSKVFEDNRSKDAIVWKDKVHSYDWLLDRLGLWRSTLSTRRVKAGSVVVLEAEFSPNAIALFLALIDHGCVLVPLTSSVRSQKREFVEIAQGQVSFVVDENDDVEIEDLPNTADHLVYAKLRKTNHPGLVLFSSGSTGKSKAAVHDFPRLLDKFRVKRHDFRTLAFLLFDHIGGIDTLLYCLSNGSCLVTVSNRSPDFVCEAIQRHKVEVLPVTPSFLNLLILSGAYSRYDLSSLKYITYATEVMPKPTLDRCREIFPQVTFLQKYGTTEVGILRSKSRSSDSAWVKVGGEGYETRIVDGLLQIKSRSSMLGYLNAPSSFTEDGWFRTGDAVEVDGEYLRILGRESDIINVGGEKVYPAEVENVIQEVEGVSDATVYGEKNPIMGNIVCAKISLSREMDQKQFASEVKNHCRRKLQNFKVPVKISFVQKTEYTGRFKKVRKK
jgi:acyl-CoA synthetase (AMP-forming)/AMP-acid ligase II